MLENVNNATDRMYNKHDNVNHQNYCLKCHMKSCKGLLVTLGIMTQEFSLLYRNTELSSNKLFHLYNSILIIFTSLPLILRFEKCPSYLLDAYDLLSPIIADPWYVSPAVSGVGGGSCRQCHVSGVGRPWHWWLLPDGCGAISCSSQPPAGEQAA